MCGQWGFSSCIVVDCCRIFSGSFKDVIYFCAGVSLLAKSSFQFGKMCVHNICLRMDMVASEGVTVDRCFFGVSDDY